ncbi:phosphonatase-like hydrolase [Gordonia sp. CPCC 205515]|uniref:phosphonatase-like hydrolase n=1 Tax=Gordonia sp. CPCC 205515 TaxID=3140791 RepID=UPI003AF3F996
MSDLTLRLAVLDMAGTTVADDGLVMHAFEAATAAAGIPATGPEHDRARQYVLDTMGQSKIVVFRALTGGDEDRAQQANAAFENAYGAAVADGGATEIAGAAETIGRLRRAGIKVALTTGFSAATRDRLLNALGWNDIADLVVAPSTQVRGRPYPDMILTALMALQIDDVREVAVLGDTANDITSGVRAGAGIVAGTLTGAHDDTALRAAGATHIVSSVTEFGDLLTH